MTDNDLATGGGEDAFTPEEQAQFDAYARGDEPAAAAPEPVGGEETVASGEAATAPTAPAGDAPGEPVEDIDLDADDDPNAEAGKNKGQWVRHGALHQARLRYRAEKQARAALETEVAEYREKFARGDERMRVLTEALNRAPQPAAAPAPEPEPVPDPSQDIFGYVQHLERQLAEVRGGQQQTAEAMRAAEETRREEAETQAIVGHYQQDVRRLVQAEPAFADAYNHLIGSRVAELKLYGLDEQQALAQARADELALVRSSLQRRVSPAEQMLALAKGRGWAPKPAEPAAPVAPQETAAEKAQRVAQGQAASKSLSAAGGAPAGEITLEMLANMSERDFEAFAAKNPAKARALMGG